MKYFFGALLAIVVLSPRAPADLSPSGSNVQIGASSFRAVSSASPTSVLNGPGALRRIVVATGVASGTVKLFDLTAANCVGTPSANPLGTVTLPGAVVPMMLEYNAAVSNGICLFSSSASIQLTVIYN